MNLNTDWTSALENEMGKDYFKELMRFVDDEYAQKVIYPNQNSIYKAFELTPLKDIKVVIIGQDPYHGEGQANGLCFSVNDGVKFPPSLRNIFKALKEDLDIEPPLWGNLERWAKQGVFLLNATLTVEAKKAGSHQKKGWEKFTDRVIELIAQQTEDTVFILWGAFAQKKKELIPAGKHLILESVHPSPLSAYRGFFENKHFSLTNLYLTDHGKQCIEW